MKTQFQTLLFILTVALLASCTKEIEFKGEQSDPRLVINSIVEPGQPVKARISKSVFFLDNTGDMEAPSDLVATLYVNGNAVGEMTPQTDTLWGTEYYWDPEPVYYVWDVYGSPYCPAEGDEVSITASAKGFDPVEGSTGTLPDLPSCRIKSLQLTERESWPTSYDDEDTTWQYADTYELTIELTDTHPSTLDCFKMSIDENYHYYDTLDEYLYHWYAYIRDYSDPIFGAMSGTNLEVIDYQISESNGTFTDQFFDGHSYNVKLSIGVSYCKPEGSTEPFRVAFYVEHITKDYYDYLNTCDQGDETMQFFAEPIQTHTNVNGGYGIVGGRTVDTLWIEIP